MLKAFLHTILVYTSAVLGYLAAVPYIIVSNIMKKDKSIPFRHATYYWGKSLLKAGDIRLNTDNHDRLKNLPEKVVFVANHASYFDIPILGQVLPFGTRFVARENLFKAPFLGWIMRNSGHISIERKGTKKTLQTIIDTAKKVERGTKVILFPEGTRSIDGELGEFKKGSLLIAKRAKAVIVPVALNGSYNIMPRHSLLIRPTHININVGEPITDYQHTAKDEIDDDIIMKKVHQQIIDLLESNPSI